MNLPDRNQERNLRRFFEKPSGKSETTERKNIVRRVHARKLSLLEERPALPNIKRAVNTPEGILDLVNFLDEYMIKTNPIPKAFIEAFSDEELKEKAA